MLLTSSAPQELTSPARFCLLDDVARRPSISEGKRRDDLRVEAARILQRHFLDGTALASAAGIRPAPKVRKWRQSSKASVPPQPERGRILAVVEKRNQTDAERLNQIYSVLNTPPASLEPQRRSVILHDLNLTETLEVTYTFPTTSELLDIAGDTRESPSNRRLAADALTVTVERSEELKSLATHLMKSKGDVELAKAGVQLANRLRVFDGANLGIFQAGAENPRWEVKTAVVRIMRSIPSAATVDVYLCLGPNLSYFVPIRMITEHLSELSELLDQEARSKAVIVLNRLLSNPRQRPQSSKRLEGCISMLGPTTTPASPLKA
jgi:hypothetical protein